ncbi:hypothetical protein [Sinosporangium siamense]|uniref:Uncharacterized protein n=1 Tax=Sinosporangium siamense TaxID=1367973 RepID=A0A919VBE5_9ACTN|nr:hypothetical protein [Sinosporangium siamense]GII97501.1 hypothetical protein Ssi02_77320 [Sinosporangium siamense]
MTVESTVDVHITRNGQLWLATVADVAGGMSGRSLKELHSEIADGLPFLFGDRDTTPMPVFHYALPGLTSEDLLAFADLQRRATAIAEDYTRTAKARVDHMHELGLTDSDIGELLGLSKQRIQQIRTGSA